MPWMEVGGAGAGQEMSLLPEYELEFLQMWLQPKMDQKDVIESTENSCHTRHLYTGYWQKRLELGGARITFCGQPHSPRPTGIHYGLACPNAPLCRHQPGLGYHPLLLHQCGDSTQVGALSVLPTSPSPEQSSPLPLLPPCPGQG